MKKLFSKEAIIGLTVLISLLIVFFGIDYLKGVNIFHPENYYYVSYTNVDGLAESAPVTVNGFKVGIVREIQYEYDNPGHVRVELSLDKSLKVPRGSKAVLVTSMLDNRPSARPGRLIPRRRRAARRSELHRADGQSQRRRDACRSYPFASY